MRCCVVVVGFVRLRRCGTTGEMAVVVVGDALRVTGLLIVVMEGFVWFRSICRLTR